MRYLVEEGFEVYIIKGCISNLKNRAYKGA